MKRATSGPRGPSRRCESCGRPWWVVIGKIRVNGRWLTLIPRVHPTRASARAETMVERRASGPGSEMITAIAPACSWWHKWPGIWTRIAWIHVREYWKAITLLDRSLAAMKRVFGGEPKTPYSNPVHIDRKLTKFVIDYNEQRGDDQRFAGWEKSKWDAPASEPMDDIETAKRKLRDNTDAV